MVLIVLFYMATAVLGDAAASSSSNLCLSVFTAISLASLLKHACSYGINTVIKIGE